jgi:hypothetical protein
MGGFCFVLLLLLLLLLWLYSPLLDLGHFFSFLILFTVGRIPCTGDQTVAGLLPTHKTTQTQNKRTQYRHQCLEWDSNPRSQRSSERKQFMPFRPCGHCHRHHCNIDLFITSTEACCTVRTHFKLSIFVRSNDSYSTVHLMNNNCSHLKSAGFKLYNFGHENNFHLPFCIEELKMICRTFMIFQKLYLNWK